MTRLSYDMIRDLPLSLPAIDRGLVQSTGHTLLELAVRTLNLPYTTAAKKITDFTAAVVPISSGQGVIPGFAAATASILRHIGMKSFVTRQSDVGGMGEAFDKRADIVFAADDEKFLAFNLKNSTVVDNTWATAAGFVQALAAAAEMRKGGLRGSEVLVLGLGRVGTRAVHLLQLLGARIQVYDVNFERLGKFLESNGAVTIAPGIEEGMQRIDYIYDATPAAEIIDDKMIRPPTLVVCPGVPHGLTAAAKSKLGARFIHDNLPLGVAVMAVQSAFRPLDFKERTGDFNPGIGRTT
jgi:pyrrolysine biosynthesis protein PylD